jgi:hypothetical protein
VPTEICTRSPCGPRQRRRSASATFPYHSEVTPPQTDKGMGAAVFHKEVASAQKTTGTTPRPGCRSPCHQANLRAAPWAWWRGWDNWLKRAWEGFGEGDAGLHHLPQRRPGENPRPRVAGLDGGSLCSVGSGHPKPMAPHDKPSKPPKCPGKSVSDLRIALMVCSLHDRGNFSRVRHERWQDQLHVHFFSHPTCHPTCR